MSYLIGFFDNLMEGGEDAESTTMVVEVVKREGWGRVGREQDDRQTDRQTGSQCRYRNMGFRYTQRGGAKWEINLYSQLS